MVDLAYAKCRSRDAIDLGLCVISSPLFVFISEEKKDAFSHALSDICPDCFLPVSVDADKFLATCQPRKIHLQYALEALRAIEVDHVNVI